MATTDVRIIEYPGETGVCLQHLGFLIGRKAHAELWPEIMSWILCKRQLVSPDTSKLSEFDTQERKGPRLPRPA